jgi:hypothetical protein
MVQPGSGRQQEDGAIDSKKLKIKNYGNKEEWGCLIQPQTEP